MTEYACTYFKLFNLFVYSKMRFGSCMGRQSAYVRYDTLELESFTAKYKKDDRKNCDPGHPQRATE